jgi:lysophospholipase L1-like esterase
MNNLSKKRVLCYGDSNVWGCIPGTTFKRYTEEVRWPKVLQKLLGSKYEIIEEGLNSRTLASVYQRPNKEGRNGNAYLVPCLYSHDPLDLVILLLGTTELKEEFHNSAQSIGKMLDVYYAKVIPQTKSQCQDTYPRLLIIAPAVIDEHSADPRYANGTTKAKQLKEIYEKVARTNNCFFIDASQLAVGSDGVHLTEKSHKKLAEALYKKIKLIEW